MANSTPIVDFDSKLNSFLVKRDNKLLFPTPESPINTTVKTIQQLHKILIMWKNKGNYINQSAISLKFAFTFENKYSEFCHAVKIEIF